MGTLVPNVLTSDVYLVLTPTFGRYSYNNNTAVSFAVSNMTKGKPKLSAGQTAVQVHLLVDAAMFSTFIPVINAVIEDQDLIYSDVVVVPNQINPNSIVGKSIAAGRLNP